MRQEREREREELGENEAKTALLHHLAAIWENNLAVVYAHLARKWSIDVGSGAQDIASAARQRLLDRRPVLQFDGVRAALSYLLRAVDSEASDRWKRFGRKLVACDGSTFDTLSAVARPAPSPEDLAVDREEREALERLVRRCQQALTQLTPKLREAVTLRWLSEPRLTCSEVAKELGISVKAAEKRCERGLGELRRSLEEPRQ